MVASVYINVTILSRSLHPGISREDIMQQRENDPPD